jgi:hypothetical protein
MQKPFWGDAHLAVQFPDNNCEIDFEKTIYIAEFYNTISNLGFIILGCYGFFWTRQRNEIGNYQQLLFASEMLIGLGSTAFHMTMWPRAIMLDAGGIFISLISYLFFCRNVIRQYVPFKAVHFLFLIVIDLVIGLSSFTGRIFCYAHLILATLIVFKLQMIKEKKTEVLNKCRIVLGVGVIALCFLVLDSVACEKLGPYVHTHALWHIFSAITLFLLFRTTVIMHSKSLN